MLRGDEVSRRGNADQSGIARWIRRYLCEQSPVQIPAGKGHMVRYEDAASDFLTHLLKLVMKQYPGAELVFAIPSNAPEVYVDLLQRISRKAGASACSMINEYRAAATGCHYLPSAGIPFLVISYSETEPEIAIVTFENLFTKSDDSGIQVLTRTTTSTGCRALDNWIVQDILVKFRMLESDPCAVRLAPLLHYEAARMREQLSVTGEYSLQLTDIPSGKTFSTVYTRTDLDRIIRDHDAAGSLKEGIRRAISAMRIKGRDVCQIKTVLLLGEGSVLSVVQDTVRSQLPEAEIYSGFPLDAIARGAAKHTTTMQRQDRIASSYALRYWDATAQEHHYRFLVHSGTRFPSAGQVARIVISGAYNGQTHLGIPIYEIGGTNEDSPQEIELVSDTGGGIRLAGPVQDADTKRQVVHANVHSPTLLTAAPPARKGEPRFECTFSLDHERNLCLSARDLVTGNLVKLNTPILRLT
jgi:molecular chaperone DnaK (HSP70)